MRVALTPLDFLERARRIYRELEAVVDGDRRFTYAELAGRAHALAASLEARGCRPSDRVAYLCPNTVELLEAYYGVLLAGCILVPLNIRLAAAELQAIVDDCEPRILVVHPTLADVADQLDGPERVDIGGVYETMLTEHDGAFVDRIVEADDEDDVCELFYTSGTTGLPKGAMLTHRNLATHAIDSALTMACTHRDVVLHTIPLFHVNGWGTPHWVTLLGGRHVMLEKFVPSDVFALIERERVTRLHLVPTMASMLIVSDERASYDTSSLVQVTVGGAPPGPVLLAELERLFGCEVICGYGMTEAAPQLTKALPKRSHDLLPEQEVRARRATTGLPNIGVDLRVLDDDDAEVPWDGATPGEICVRSNHVMAGYWNKPQATDEVLRGGWLRTGDVATVDAEGYVTIVDRKKDLIISGGENISSVEVEKALCEHPAVLEAAVVGMPDERWGEVPRAFVVLRPGAAIDGGGETLRTWASGRLAKFKVPKRIDVVDDLPKGGSGKILKNELRQCP
ncbi:MAG TPA: long-chain-fatty-acid--CoA ligase [Acidimicrobiales bacterium]|nr:long-chain-fatty-acid--CoA ligase [Acidimicrobiales bacterium]